jgi:NDP-sugar pyrophosphorylase family protein
MSSKAVILAGGLGTRLKPFTEVIPKPLLPVGEKAVLEIQIEHLKKYAFDEVFLATNYMADYIENFFGDGSRYGVQLTVSREDKPLGTAGPLKLLEAKLTDAFLVMNGDILSLMDYAKFFEFALAKQTILTVAVKKIITPYAFGNIGFEGDLVTHIEEKPNIITYALAGLYVMQPEIFSLIPEGQYFGMDKLIQTMLDRGMPIAKYEMQEYWLDIGRIDDYQQARDAYEQHFKG